MSFSGRGYFTHCSECGRFILVNAIWWSPDFAGDGGGQAPVAKPICSNCAKGHRPRNIIA